MIQPDLGRKVAELRKYKGMTQETLAELCGVTVRTIQRIEAGTADPRSFTVDNLSKYLEYNFSGGGPSSDLWAAAVHLSSCICIIPIPLIIWTIGRKQADFDSDAKKAINFQLTMTIILILLVILLIIGGSSAGFLADSGKIEGKSIITASIVLVGLLIATGIICFTEGIVNTARVLGQKKAGYFPSARFLRN